MTQDQITTYRLKHLPGAHFVRRPVSIKPTDGAVCWVDRGTATTAERYQVGIFADGEWRNGKGKPLASPPTFWTEMVKDA